MSKFEKRAKDTMVFHDEEDNFTSFMIPHLKGEKT